MQEEPDWRPAGSSDSHGYHVAVEVAFIPERSHPYQPGWFYAYRIRIENRAGVEARLSERHWRITDATGAVHEVDGPGVVGQHPTLAPGSSFVYTSACPLPTPFGSMRGWYDFVPTAGGAAFEVRVPEFVLVEPHAIN